MASDAEKAKAALAAKLAQLQVVGAAQPRLPSRHSGHSGSNQASKAVELDEADTRVIIDDQLKAVGWEADSRGLTWAKGARPEKGKNKAIAEWPTETGPSDYVLFIGLMPVATVEAKRKNIDVSGADGGRRSGTAGVLISKPVCFRRATNGVTFGCRSTFSSNGRPYLKQLATKSGTWFCDVRRPTNNSRALDAWYPPEGLLALLKRDEAKADAGLKVEPFNYGFPLRPYQKDAIQAVEAGIASGQPGHAPSHGNFGGRARPKLVLLLSIGFSNSSVSGESCFWWIAPL